MNANYVKLGDRVLVDLRDDTVSEEDVVKGKIFHKADGSQSIGELTSYDGGTQSQVIFYDYDGTVVSTLSLEEAQTLSELPTPPEHEGLTFQGWNYSLSDINTSTRSKDVGAMYITDDGKTRIYVTLTEYTTSVKVGLAVNGTVTIDWGDDTTPSVLTGTSVNTVNYTEAHEYAIHGDYVIGISVDDGQAAIYSGGGSAYNAPHLLCSGSMGYYESNHTYSNTIHRVEIGLSMGIGYGAFRTCRNLTNVVIPDSVTKIDSDAFYQCINLTSIVIPDGVTSIGGSAFLSCYNLTNVVIPDGVTGINSYTFSECSNLTNVVIPDGVTIISNAAFQSCRNLTSVVIPDGVTKINSSTFNSCHNLTSVVIPDGVTSIGGSAFSNCSNLTNVVIPDGVTSIGSSAFDYCYGVTSVVIPDGVTKINSSTFNSCHNLTSVVIPDGVTSIGSSAFSYCRNLTNVVIPDGVTSIGGSAFSYCTSLTSINIPDGVTSIEYSTFRECHNLTSVVIPDGVTSIGSSAFSCCYILNICDFSNHTFVPTLSSSSVFEKTPNTLQILVPTSLYDEWISATNWSYLASKIVAV